MSTYLVHNDGVSHHLVHVGRFPKVGRDQKAFVISGLQDIRHFSV